VGLGAEDARAAVYKTKYIGVSSLGIKASTSTWLFPGNARDKSQSE